MFKQENFILFICFIIMTFCFSIPWINGDGYGYYAIAQRVVENFDIDISKQEYLFEYPHVAEKKPDNSGYFAPYGIGWALHYFVPMMIAKILSTRIFILSEYNHYSVLATEIPFHYHLSISIWNILTTILVLKMIISIAKNYFKSKWIIYICIFAFITSSMIAYVFHTPGYSHASTFFWATCACYFFFLRENERENYCYHCDYLIGFSLGFIILIRPQSSFFCIGITFGYIIATYFKYNIWKTRNIAFLFFILGALPCAITFLNYNINMYGSSIGLASISGTMPPINDNLKDMFIDIYRDLFSLSEGLFIWTPIALFGFIGLILASKREIWLKTLLIGTIAHIFFYALINLGAGYRFGARYYDVTFPTLTLGFILFYQKLSSRILKCVVIILCSFTIFCYITFDFSWYCHKWFDRYKNPVQPIIQTVKDIKTMHDHQLSMLSILYRFFWGAKSPRPKLLPILLGDTMVSPHKVWVDKPSLLLSAAGNWIWKGNSFVTFGLNSSDSLTYYLKEAIPSNSVIPLYLRHPWSGAAKIYWGTESKEVILYAPFSTDQYGIKTHSKKPVKSITLQSLPSLVPKEAKGYEIWTNGLKINNEIYTIYSYDQVKTIQIGQTEAEIKKETDTAWWSYNELIINFKGPACLLLEFKANSPPEAFEIYGDNLSSPIYFEIEQSSFPKKFLFGPWKANQNLVKIKTRSDKPFNKENLTDIKIHQNLM